MKKAERQFLGVRKAVKKVEIGRLNLINRAYGAITDTVNGKRNASYIINLLTNDGFSKAHIMRLTEGQPSDRQIKAVDRCIYGRHYARQTLEALTEFLSAPNEFNKVIPIKPAKIWINVTQINEERGSEENRRIFTAAELEMLKNF